MDWVRAWWEVLGFGGGFVLVLNLADRPEHLPYPPQIVVFLLGMILYFFVRAGVWLVSQ